MKWHYLNTGSRSGKYNMQLDIELAKSCRPANAYFRLFRWEPYCISLGANQLSDSVLKDKAEADGIDVVFRPTGGRAILHGEELTYSFVYPLENNPSAKNLYKEINTALLKGLSFYDVRLRFAELENMQPDFSSFYKEDASAACFAASAKSEVKFDGKKLIGSAQRKLESSLLQHGSILCGSYHKKLADYLNLPEGKKEEVRKELNEKTIELSSILNEEVDYDMLSNCLLKGFEEHFLMKFEDEDNWTINSGINERKTGLENLLH